MTLATTLRTFRLALAFAAPALAGAQARGAAAEYTGSRTGAVLEVGGNYTSSFTVAWSVTQAQGGLLRYTYTFTGFTSPGISHLVVGLSDSCRQSLTCVLSPTVRGVATADYEIRDFVPGANGNSNPGLAGSFYGVKINTPGGVGGGSGIMFSFLSDRTPVYGDFYVKGGSSSYAQNDGLLPANLQSGNANLFVARPDTNSVVPEPSTYALVATGVAGLGVAARRRRA